MKEEKHIRKLRTTLHKIFMSISLWDKEKTCIGIIRKRADDCKDYPKYLLSRNYPYKPYIDALYIIDKYNMSEEVVKKLYFIEDNKRISFSENKNLQTPITFRDNKGVYIGSGGSGSNKIRYPRKTRSLQTWKKFYEMFPSKAKLDNWDGKTSDKMK